MNFSLFNEIFPDAINRGQNAEEASFPRTHTIRHPHPVGFPGTSHRSVAEAATYTTRNKH